MIKWSQVTSDSRWGSSTPEQRQVIRKSYYDRHFAPRIPKGQEGNAWARFTSLTDKDVGVAPTTDMGRVRQAYPKLKPLQTFGVEEPEAGVIGSAGEGFLKGFLSPMVSAYSAVDPESGLRAQEALEQALPAKGKAGFVGTALGGIVPSGAALLTPGGQLAVLPFYGVSGFGAGRETVRKIEKKTKIDISGWLEFLGATGFGVAEVAGEKIGLDALGNLAVKRFGGKIGKEILKSLKTGDELKAKALAAVGVALRSTIGAGIESGEETATQGVQSAIESALDPYRDYLSKQTLDDIKAAALGGAIGGKALGLMQGVRAARRTLGDLRALEQPVPPQSPSPEPEGTPPVVEPSPPVSEPSAPIPEVGLGGGQIGMTDEQHQIIKGYEQKYGIAKSAKAFEDITGVKLPDNKLGFTAEWADRVIANLRELDAEIERGRAEAPVSETVNATKQARNRVELARQQYEDELQKEIKKLWGRGDPSLPGDEHLIERFKELVGSVRPYKPKFGSKKPVEYEEYITNVPPWARTKNKFALAIDQAAAELGVELEVLYEALRQTKGGGKYRSYSYKDVSDLAEHNLEGSHFKRVYDQALEDFERLGAEADIDEGEDYIPPEALEYIRKLEVKDGSENIAGISGQVGEGAQPVQAQLEQGRGGAAAQTGGVVQEPSKSKRQRIKRSLQQHIEATAGIVEPELHDAAVIDEIADAAVDAGVPAEKIDDVVDAVQAKQDASPDTPIEQHVAEAIAEARPAAGAVTTAPAPEVVSAAAPVRSTAPPPKRGDIVEYQVGGYSSPTQGALPKLKMKGTIRGFDKNGNAIIKPFDRTAKQAVRPISELSMPIENPRLLKAGGKYYHRMADGETYSEGRGKPHYTFDQLRTMGDVQSVSISTQPARPQAAAAPPPALSLAEQRGAVQQQPRGAAPLPAYDISESSSKVGKPSILPPPGKPAPQAAPEAPVPRGTLTPQERGRIATENYQIKIDADDVHSTLTAYKSLPRGLYKRTGGALFRLPPKADLASGDKTYRRVYGAYRWGNDKTWFPITYANIGKFPEMAHLDPAFQTQSVYVNEVASLFKLTPKEVASRKSLREQHRRIVEAAVKEGKPVPTEVLADYPDIAAKSEAPAIPPLTATGGGKPVPVAEPPVPRGTLAVAPEPAKAGRKGGGMKPSGDPFTDALADIQKGMPVRDAAEKNGVELARLEKASGQKAASQAGTLFEGGSILSEKGSDAAERLRKKYMTHRAFAPELSSEDLVDFSIIGRDLVKAGVRKLEEFTNRLVAIVGENSRIHAPRIWNIVKPPEDEEPVSIKNAETEKILVRLGLATSKNVQHHSIVVDRVVSGNMIKDAPVIAQSIIADPRPISDDEAMALTLYMADLQDSYNAKAGEIARLKSEGKPTKVEQSQLDAIDAQQGAIAQAATLGGTETARSLEIRKVYIKITDSRYELANVLNRLAVAKLDKQVTAIDRAKAEQLVSELKQVKAQIADFGAQQVASQESVTEKLAQETAHAAHLRADAISRKREIIEQKQRRNAEIAELLRVKFKTARAIAPVLDEKDLRMIGEWAINAIEIKAIKASVVLDEIIRAFPFVSRQDAAKALALYHHKEEKRAREATTHTVSRLKRAANLADDAVKDPTPARIQRLDVALSEIEKDEKRLAKLRERIKAAREHLDAGTRPPRKQRKPDSKAVEVAKRELSEIRRMMNAEDKIKDLQEQLKSGIFKEHHPRPVQDSPELYALKRRAYNLRGQIDRMIRDARPLTTWQKTREVLTLPRSLIASSDMSASLRQAAWIAATNPIIWTKSYGKAFSSFWSANKAEKIDYDLRNRLGFAQGEKAGLWLTDIDGVLHRREEIFMSRLAERIPIIGHIVKAGNRNMVTMLNSVRVGVFDDFVRRHPEATDEALRAFAKYVNAATGRGSLGSFERASADLSIVLFAPRFAVSRFQAPYFLFKGMATPGLRKEMARDLVALLGTGLSLLGLAWLAGARVGFDPRSPDFGKIRIGDTRIDIWAGEVQIFRFLYNSTLSLTPKKWRAKLPVMKGWKGGMELGDLVSRFISYKLSPTITIPLALVRGKDIMGQPINYTEWNPNNVIISSLAPLFIQDAWTVGENQGLVPGLLAGAASHQGLSISNYKDKRRSYEPPSSQSNR